jgi:hypothetical protein
MVVVVVAELSEANVGREKSAETLASKSGCQSYRAVK